MQEGADLTHILVGFYAKLENDLWTFKLTYYIANKYSNDNDIPKEILQ